AEIKTLEAFYQGNDKAKHEGGLTHYLRYGVWTKLTQAVTAGSRAKAAEKAPVKNQVIQDIVNAVTAEAMPPVKKLIEESADKMYSTEPANFEEVVAEINGDLAALQDYLKNSVFYAAGFITYCNQELERIRNRFKDMEDNDRQWIGIIRTAVKYEKNPNIPYNIVHTRRDFRMRREIAVELKEIRESCTNVF
ncbi:MAG: dynamin family protein, partial [Methylobacter sp.]